MGQALAVRATPAAPGPPGGRRPGRGGPRACALDEAALRDARRRAADWRATGLRVVLVQRRSAAGGGRESYELVAESPHHRPDLYLPRLAARRRPAGPTAWTVAVSTRRSAGDPDGAREAARDVGVAASASHEAAWRQVLAWIDGAGRLHADVAEALGAVARPEPRSASPASRSRAPLAAVAAVLFAVGLWCGHLVLHRSAPAIAAQPEAEPARADAAPADGPTPAHVDAGPPPAPSGVPAGRTDASDPGRAGPADGQDAERELRAALERSEREFGPQHPATAAALAGLGALYGDEGRYGEAEPLLRRALAIDETALGPDRPEVALGLLNLAGLYHLEGRRPEAEPLYRRALAIVEEALGPDHPDVAIVLGELGELYRDEGRDAEAEPLLERALAIGERVFGPGDPETVRTRDALATLRLGRERQGEVAAPPAAEPMPRDRAPGERQRGEARLLAGGALSGVTDAPRPSAADPSPADGAPDPGSDPGSKTLSEEMTPPAPSSDSAAPPRQGAGPGSGPSGLAAEGASRTASGGGAPARPAPAPADGRYAIQVAAVRDAREVPDTWRRLSQRHPALAALGPRPPRAVTVPGRGTLFRVAGGAFATEAEARALCDRLRAEGADCRVVAF